VPAAHFAAINLLDSEAEFISFHLRCGPVNITMDNLSQATMKNGKLKSMSVDDLWELRESVVAELGRKMAAERAMLENRLRRLGAVAGHGGLGRERRPYPKIFPKYRNPKNRSETWAGRGKQPRWLTAQLRSGRKLTDFLIRRDKSNEYRPSAFLPNGRS